MKFIKIFLLSFCLIIFSANAVAKPNSNEVKDELVNIDFRNLEIADFVKLVSKIMGKNILLQSTVAGKVEFISTKPVYKKDLPMILQSTLAARGFTMVDRGSFMEVVQSKDVSKYNLPFAKGKNKEYTQMVTEIISVNGANAEIIAAKIRHLASASSVLMPVRENNTILVTDFPENIETIKDVVKHLENNAVAKISFIKLEKTSADQIFPVLRGIVTDAFDKKIENEKVSVFVDIPGNTIVAVGVSKNLDKVREIVRKLDNEQESLRKVTKVIRLKNSEVKEVHAILNQVLAASRAGRGSASAPILAADITSNSLVLIGNQKDYEEFVKIVEELDKEQRQVYVKARIIEISDTKADRIGVKYGLSGGKANSSGLFSFALNMGGPTVALDGILQSSIKPGDLKSGLAFGAAVDFLTTNEAANIISEPSILCLDNLESKIYVGETRSILTSSATKKSTTDLGTNTYSRQDIGLTLKVKPRISNDGKVTLQMNTILEDVLGNQSADSSTPTTTKREVVTRAIVKNGESVIVGGLIRDKETENDSKVPGLGDIPLFGKAFSHSSDSIEKTNIVIILTPFIVDKSEDLATLRQDLAELDKIQEEYNIKFKRELEKRRLEIQKKLGNNKEEKEEHKKYDTHEEVLKRLNGDI